MALSMPGPDLFFICARGGIDKDDAEEESYRYLIALKLAALILAEALPKKAEESAETEAQVPPELRN